MLPCDAAVVLAVAVVIWGVAVGGGGGGGGDPFNTLDLCSGTPYLSLSGIRLQSLLLSQN